MTLPNRRRVGLFLMIAGIAACTLVSIVHADTDPAATAIGDSPAAALVKTTPPDLDALIDNDADFADLDYAVPANIERRPAVLPTTASTSAGNDDASAAFPNEDSE